MIRRLVFTGVASFLYSSPTAQVQLIVMHSVIVLMYIQLARPFETPVLNQIELFNEFTILVAACHMFAFTDYLGDPTMQYTVGWSMIAVTVLNIAANILVIIYFTAKQLRLTYKLLKVRFALWRKGSKLSVLWTGVPLFKQKNYAELETVSIKECFQVESDSNSTQP